MPEGRSGNGWATCAQGHQHWGLFGAAGLLVYVPQAADPALIQVLVQRRSRRAHQGGTWALPGGAMDSDETPAEAALREADEECMLDPKLVVPRGLHLDEHGGWTYYTVLAEAAEPLRVQSDGYEADDAVWQPAGEVGRLDLHPGFAASWPALRAALVPLTVLVDGTSAADGPPGPGELAEAGRRLYARLADLTRSGLTALPGGLAAPPLARWYPDYVLVLEAAGAAAAASTAAAETARAAGAAPRYSWNEPLTARTAEVRTIAVTDGGQAADVLADLAGGTPGLRLVVSGRRAVRDRAAAAGAGVADLVWLLGPAPAALPAAPITAPAALPAATTPPAGGRTAHRTVMAGTNTAWRHQN